MTVEEVLFDRYRGKRLLLDANLLLLFLIGTFDRNLIRAFKRTAGFATEDYDILANLLPLFRNLITTPQLLTEVASLANSLPESLKPQWHDHLRVYTVHLFEILTPSIDLMQEPAYLPFGLADASVFAASADALVLTKDFRLSGYLRSRDRPVLNFRDVLSIAAGRA